VSKLGRSAFPKPPVSKNTSLEQLLLDQEVIRYGYSYTVLGAWIALGAGGAQDSEGIQHLAC
jgi:hypothetical protein